MVEYFTGQFFHQAITERFTSETYQAFLLHILNQTSQQLFIIQDGARYHTSRAMKAFFAQHQQRLTVFQLPSYSPDFNPIEFLWKKLIQRATHNRHFDVFDKLIETVDDALAYFANAPDQVLALMGRYCETLGVAV
jgi:transposase